MNVRVTSGEDFFLSFYLVLSDFLPLKNLQPSPDFHIIVLRAKGQLHRGLNCPGRVKRNSAILLNAASGNGVSGALAYQRFVQPCIEHVCFCLFVFSSSFSLEISTDKCVMDLLGIKLVS